MAVAALTTRTLATLAPGESGRVESFLFAALRTMCEDMGLRLGEVVRCRAGTAGVLVLDTESGLTLSLARDWARFIHVGDAVPLVV